MDSWGQEGMREIREAAAAVILVPQTRAGESGEVGRARGRQVSAMCIILPPLDCKGS